MNAVFPNRRDAGQKLAQQLVAYTNKLDVIVLALPRGGVPVAYEIAKELNLPLDVCLVRKLGLPAHPEMAMGSIAEDALLPDYSGEITIIDRDTTKQYGVKELEIQAIAAKEKAELRWRESCYRHYRPMLAIANRTLIVVDDGISTGLTMHAAVEVLSQHQPAGMIIATPVASHQAIARLKRQVDNFICLVAPKSLGAVGFWYEDFSPTTDKEVCDLLNGQSCQNYAGSCFS
jgi:putative phosphoribosyl transferase